MGRRPVRCCRRTGRSRQGRKGFDVGVIIRSTSLRRAAVFALRGGIAGATFPAEGQRLAIAVEPSRPQLVERHVEQIGDGLVNRRDVLLEAVGTGGLVVAGGAGEATQRSGGTAV